MTKCNYLHPGLCFLLQKLGVVKEEGEQWRYVHGGTNFELVGIGDPYRVYAPNAVPNNLTLYRYVACFTAAELMDLVPDVQVIREGNMYKASCAMFSCEHSKIGEDVTEALGYLLIKLIQLKYIPVGMINNKIKEACRS